MTFRLALTKGVGAWVREENVPFYESEAREKPELTFLGAQVLPPTSGEGRPPAQPSTQEVAARPTFGPCWRLLCGPPRGRWASCHRALLLNLGEWQALLQAKAATGPVSGGAGATCARGGCGSNTGHNSGLPALRKSPEPRYSLA